MRKAKCTQSTQFMTVDGQITWSNLCVCVCYRVLRKAKWAQSNPIHDCRRSNKCHRIGVCVCVRVLESEVRKAKWTQSIQSMTLVDGQKICKRSNVCVCMCVCVLEYDTCPQVNNLQSLHHSQKCTCMHVCVHAYQRHMC